MSTFKSQASLHLFLILIVLSLGLWPHTSFAAAGCGHDCNQCHKITVKDIEPLVAHEDGIKILQVVPAQIKGLWEVVAEKDGKKGLFYVDYEKKHILYGAIYNPATNSNSTQEAYEKVTTIDLTGLKSANAIILGNKAAKKKVYVFSDPRCPHCAKFHDELKKIAANDKSVAFYIMLIKVPSTQDDAYQVAKSIQCSKSLKLLESSYHGDLLPEATCKSTVVDDNIEFAKNHQITGTPTVIFSNGKMHFGYLKADELKKLIASNTK